MKNKEELLIKQAKEGYTVCYIDQCPLCYIDQCPLHNQCLRWLVTGRKNAICCEFVWILHFFFVSLHIIFGV